MYNWVTTRKIPRTEGPTYPARAVQTVDAVVAKWIPVSAALLACFVTPARATLDARYYESPTYPVRAAQTVDAVVRTWQPADTTELASFSTPARPPLDVRRYEWAPEFVSIPRLIDPTLATWAPTFATELATFSTRARLPLEVRSSEWTQDGWRFSALTPAVTPAQAWPAMLAATLGARTSDHALLDVRSFDWAPQTGWIPTSVDAVTRTWAPIFSAELQAFRTVARATLDVRAYDWVLRGVPADANPAQQLPAWQLALGVNYRTADVAKLDVRGYEWQPQPAWIFSTLPVTATTAQIWPAILEGAGLSYRTDARPGLDVRRYDWLPQFGWSPKVVDGIVATWIPVFDAEASHRTADGPRLNVRALTSEPESAWFAAVITFSPPVTLPTVRLTQVRYQLPTRTTDPT